ncbi:hypothetical protein JZ751_000999 [Albula glossodonta]|uniref:Uncharacterized protein n=1 Tax=Albula glossodonta TaxID=121402 RepID=A0A8T2PXS4_9TELE|nr:hypothetical protein JZ751_000999 [Albula glossodonta]
MKYLCRDWQKGIAALLFISQTAIAMVIPNSTHLEAILEKYLDEDGEWAEPKQRGRRAITESDMHLILDLHNKLRGQVYPQASNMEYMEAYGKVCNRRAGMAAERKETGSSVLQYCKERGIYLDGSPHFSSVSKVTGSTWPPTRLPSPILKLTPGRKPLKDITVKGKTHVYDRESQADLHLATVEIKAVFSNKSQTDLSCSSPTYQLRYHRAHLIAQYICAVNPLLWAESNGHRSSGVTPRQREVFDMKPEGLNSGSAFRQTQSRASPLTQGYSLCDGSEYSFSAAVHPAHYKIVGL